MDIKINDILYNRIREYCSLNEIGSINNFIEALIEEGFNITKYGIFKPQREVVIESKNAEWAVNDDEEELIESTIYSEESSLEEKKIKNKDNENSENIKEEVLKKIKKPQKKTKDGKLIYNPKKDDYDPFDEQ